MNHYDDWDSIVHCSFQNVFTSGTAYLVGDNIQKILGITHFKPREMASQSPLPYDFTCKRKEANQIRDELVTITTDLHRNIWFSMQTDPFHYIHNRHSMNNDNQVKTNDYSVYCYFGAMYSWYTFNIHSEDHPSIQELRILKWQREPETVRIMSKDKSRQMFIPVRGIHKSILVNLKERPCVVLMLKHAVTMKRQFTTNGKNITER